MIKMKIPVLFPLLGTCLFLACSTAPKAQTPSASTANTPTQVAPMPAFVSWDKKMVDLGEVKKGEKRSLFFELTNTSGQEIQIDIVDACECTKVDFPRGPISPGGKGRFDVVFDSTEKDADETIGITIVFRETDARGNPRIESVAYKFELIK
jgi:peptidoglycan-associated lipoprotein